MVRGEERGKENSLTTLMSTTARPWSESIHIDIDQLFVRTPAVPAFLSSSLYVRSCVRTDLCGRRRRVFARSALDYLGILLKYGAFPSNGKICGTNSRGSVHFAMAAPRPSSVRVGFNFHLFTCATSQMISFVLA